MSEQLKNPTTNGRKDASKSGDAVAPVVVDLGKHKRGRVKDLRNGTGPLMSAVLESFNELQASGTVSKDARPVVVIVREKRKKSLRIW